jgi:AcrR family transcriptional regulator
MPPPSSPSTSQGPRPARDTRAAPDTRRPTSGPRTAPDTRRPSSGPRTARDTRPAPAKRRLLDAALERFGTEGPVGVTLDDVRREAGVSVGALYHHFGDKEALLDGLFLDLTERFQAGFLAELRVRPGAEEGIGAGVRFYLKWVATHRAGARVLLGHRPDTPELEERNRRFFVDVMGWWNTHAHYGSLRPLPFDLVHALWLGAAQEYCRHWLAGHARRTPTGVADELANAAWRNLAGPRADPMTKITKEIR